MSEHDRLAERLAAAMQLVRVTGRLAAEQDLDRILDVVTAGVRDALVAERGSLFVYDRDTRELFTRTTTDLEVREIRIPCERGVAGWVAGRRELANIPCAADDSRWSPDSDRVTGFQTQNVLAAPVVSNHDERLLGVLQVLNKRSGAFDEFDEQLITAFAAHAATALERAQLVEEARRSEYLRVLLEVGRRIQTAFLPRHVPNLPGYDIATWWEPAEQLGGDYYDLVPLPDGRLGVVIADVSGHGYGPSLIMASARAMLRVLARTFSEPEAILSLTSESIADDLTDGLFITMCAVAIDPRDHALVYANAGHGPTLLYRAGADVFEELVSTAPPLGFTDDHVVPTGLVRHMNHGDVLFLSTDGVIETRSPSEELFGEERLEAVLRRHAREPARNIAEAVNAELRAFQPAGNVEDDVTFVVVRRGVLH